MIQEDTSTDILTVETEEVSEESPLLIAQRYLNIFRQMHIFKAKKKSEFDTELLNMPDKIKKVLIDIPGGRILLEHILELEEQNGFDPQLTSALISQRKKNSSFEIGNQSHLQGELHLGADFANVLAKSLASALGRSPYPLQLPQITQNGTEITPLSTDADGNQLNTQNNVAATTVNHINVDYSIFQNLAEAISQTNSSLAQVLRENSRQQLEEIKTFSRTITNAILGKTDLQNPTTTKIDATKSFRASETRRANNETQTVSVTNKIINPITSKSTVQKTSYTIPKDTSPTNAYKQTAPSQKKANPLLQAENAIARTGLNVKPISLSTDDNTSSFTLAPRQEEFKPKFSAYEEYSLDENLNMHQTSVSGTEEEWEYVDEYGNPVSDASYDEWEYVDEYGNPISNASYDEWEYVDEYGNPINNTPQQPKAATITTPSFVPPRAAQPATPYPTVGTRPKVEEKVKITETPVAEKPKVEAKFQENIKEDQQKNKEIRKDAHLQPQETEDNKETKSGGIFSSLFKKKETSEDKNKEEPKKDSADDVLAAAFSKAETKAEEIKKEQTPRIGGILAEAYQEIEREQKNISSKDLLAQAFKNKPQSTADVLADAFAQKAEQNDNKDDSPAAAFTKTETKSEEPQKDLADDALISAFNKPKEKKTQNDEFDALIKAFNS